MKKLGEQEKLLKKIMSMLENQFPDSEIVLHDFTQPHEHTIVDIRNGHITGRKIGDCLTNYGLEVLSGTTKDMDKFNYITYLPSSTILRSSSVYFTDDDGKVIGSLCINTDITQESRYEDYLRRKNNLRLSTDENSETLPKNVNELLDYLISESQASIGKSIEEMSREDKIQFLKLLDQKGAFLITKSSEKICDYLKISKYTLYKYLELAHDDENTL